MALPVGHAAFAVRAGASVGLPVRFISVRRPNEIYITSARHQPASVRLRYGGGGGSIAGNARKLLISNRESRKSLQLDYVICVAGVSLQLA